jgi:hypothetical protein
MKTLTAEKELTRIQKHAEKIRNDDAHTLADMTPGDMWAQGDVGLICLASLPDGCTVEKKPSAQLAPGTTQGSRHCITDLSAVRLHRLADPTPLDGPIIEAPQGVTVNHPEHGAITLPPGIYGCVYQRAYADDLRRVQD